MKKVNKRLIWIIIALFVILGGWRYWNARQAAAGKMVGAGGGAAGPMPLPVVGCKRQTVPEILELTGTTAASQKVDIRARVEGFLKEIHFQEGQPVTAGQLLFVIEPERYLAQKEQAQASLAAALAQKAQAESDLQRISQAVAVDAVSRQDLTRAEAALQTAQAAAQAAQAALTQAELQLSYTRICAPISGRITRRAVDIGNLVGAVERTWLATIYQTQPLYVYFNIADRFMTAELLERLRGGQPLSFSVLLPDNTPFAEQGRVDYIDPAIQTDTGVVQARGILENKADILQPGLFVRVRLPIKTLTDALVIPQKVIQTDLQGKYVLTVGQNNMLSRKNIQIGQSVGELQVVLSGLNGDEQILAGGFAMAREGMPIQPVPADAPPMSAPKP